jgi:hypothetical protein
MLLHNYELGCPQQGNNNRYGQDSELTWINVKRILSLLCGPSTTARGVEAESSWTKPGTVATTDAPVGRTGKTAQRSVTGCRVARTP